jgi:prepilin signal peptidase PulO-like enzyme (type II secretory pathway)
LLNYWLEIPLWFRYVLLALVSLFAASPINWAIYSLAYGYRPISPWSRYWQQCLEKMTPDDEVTRWRSVLERRRWWNFLPLAGWLSLRHEQSLHGRWFWLRPMLMEVGFAVAACALYWHFTQTGRAVPFAFADFLSDPKLSQWLHTLFVVHWILLGFMLVATFIDFDEQTVPDAITVPGTLTALVLASFTYQLFLPVTQGRDGVIALEPVLINSPESWNTEWNSPRGLIVGLLLYTAWCLALSHRRFIGRRGWAKGIRYFIAGWLRYTTWKWLIPVWIGGLSGIVAVYQWGGMHWNGLLSSLLGMAIGGAAVWGVRIIAGAAMRQEAMGFGDVTLMAMIGAFIGWQGSLLAFMLAPMTAIVIVLIQYAVTRNRAVPFGPYLCAGAFVTVWNWQSLWDGYGAPAFSLGPILPMILISLLCLMGVMLVCWRWIKETFIYGDG